MLRLRDHCLKKRSDFAVCYERGRRFYSRNFIIFAACGAGPFWRFGLTVSKKVGSAVSRNRVKRVLRECFRLKQQCLQPGLDMVVVPRRGLKPAEFTLAQAVEELLPLFDRMAEKRPGAKKVHKTDAGGEAGYCVEV